MESLKAAATEREIARVVGLLNDPDWSVTGRAIKLLEQWSGEDFGVRLADTVPFLNQETGIKEFRAEGLARTRVGLKSELLAQPRIVRPAPWWRRPAWAAAGGGWVAGAEAALAAALMDGKAYLNIHTAFAPGGEIRGFLVPSVPEPGMGWAGALLFFGLVGANAWRRR